MPDPKNKKKRLGQPLVRTDQQLDRLSVVTEADKQAAAVLWRTNCPPGFENLLEAKVEESAAGQPDGQ